METGFLKDAIERDQFGIGQPERPFIPFRPFVDFLLIQVTLS